MRRPWLKTIFARSWVTIFILLFVTQTALLTGMYLLGARPTAEFLGRLTLTIIDLLDIAVDQENPLLLDQFAAHLQRGDGILFDRHPLSNVKVAGEWEYPALSRARDIIRAHVSEEYRVEVVVSPARMILLTTPRYTLGVPIAMAGAVFLWMAASLVIIALALPIAYLLAARLAKPLLDLADAARVIGTSPDMRINVDPGVANEVKIMALALDSMRLNIDTMIRQRERFLSEIVHDIRAPLTRVRVSAAQLGDHVDGARFILQDLDEVQVILEQTIELTRLDIEADEPWGQSDLNKLTEQVITKYQRSGRMIHSQLGEVPHWTVRTIGITRILYNLIDNGLRHGDGRVIIVTDTVNDRPRLIVRSGVNDIPGRDVPLYLGMGASGGKGSGLGALIVQRLATVHGASVTQVQNSEFFEVAVHFDCQNLRSEGS